MCVCMYVNVYDVCSMYVYVYVVMYVMYVCSKNVYVVCNVYVW